MKKNLLSILILALLVVDIILTSITMFSVTTTNKKTASIVTQIASVLELDLNAAGEDGAQEVVSIADTAVYDIAEEMTIPLKTGADGEAHYALVSVSLSMNTKNEDYENYGETISAQESLIRGEIVEAFSKYTMEEIKADQNLVREDILKRIQEMFDSDFVYKVSFREIILQ